MMLRSAWIKPRVVKGIELPASSLTIVLSDETRCANTLPIKCFLGGDSDMAVAFNLNNDTM